MSVEKPHWLHNDVFRDLLRSCDGVPRCVVTGETEDLHVDHIVPKARGGTDDVSNLQFLAARLNASKGPRPDAYWSRSFYWDQTPNFAALRGAQGMLWESIISYRTHFSLPANQIARALYVNGWLVGSGKTIGIAVAASAFNHVQRERWGAPRRADTILVLTKEQAIRDQIVADLQHDLVEYKVFPRAPRVDVLDAGWKLDSTNWLDENDVVVACAQLLWAKDGRRIDRCEAFLDRFAVIAFDEPHYAAAQARELVDLASRSVCFGYTGTPITGMGQLLPKMVGLTVYGYDQAVAIDKSVKYITNIDAIDDLVNVMGVQEAELLVRGEQLLDSDSSRPGYDKNMAPKVAVVRRIVWDMIERDRQEGLDGHLAPHRIDLDGMVRPVLHYPVHALVVVDSVELGQMLAKDVNAFFAQNRGEFPAEMGYAAKMVYTDREGESGQYLRPEHPWFRAYKQGRVTKDCARVLVVCGIGREGINNPWCGLVGVACSIGSDVEGVQRVFGRQMRAYVRKDGETLLVPSAPLDTVHIVTHEVFENDVPLRRALKFLWDMEGHLEALPSVDALRKDGLPKVHAEDREVVLPRKDLVDIAALAGTYRKQNGEVPWEDIVARFAPNPGKRRDRVAEFVATLADDHDQARHRLGFDVELQPVPIVQREYLSDHPTERDLESFLRTRGKTELLPLEGKVKVVVEAWYRDEMRKFHLPPIESDRGLEEVRKGLRGMVMEEFGGHLVGGKEARDSIFRLLNAAIKKKLDVPQDRKVAIGSQWDTPQAIAILLRPDSRAEIKRWVMMRLVRDGFCPSLEYLFDDRS